MRIAPGGPFDLEKSFSPEVERNIKSLYGLDKPLVIQYLIYLKNICTLDLGYSFTYLNRPVSRIILGSFKVSLLLGSCALLIALIAGSLCGILSALKKGKAIDLFFFSFSLFGVSIPSIILGPLLVLIFGLWLKVLPVAGWGSFSNVILPSITLAAIYSSFIARIVRASFLENIDKDYVKTARGMGMGEGKVIFKYVLRGSLLPLISYLGPAFAGIITGSLVVERIFGINGLGEHFVQSALNRDYTLALGTVVFYSSILLIVNLLCDVLYMVVDPRIEYEKAN